MIPINDIISILQTYQDNPTYTQEKIAKKLLLSKITVKTVLANNKIYHGSSALTPAEKDFIKANLHIKIKDLANLVDTKYLNVYNYLRSIGIKKNYKR